ncbi:MAG: folate-binding protein YgfZ, partial [Mycobacteriaceae bacterium]|nr:folate-binding protein YgfZ [Mycobacteriaceae bacterium]
MATSSPLLALPGAVAGLPDSPDVGVAWHYGDPFAEQRAAAAGVAVVDRSHRPVLAISGAERLSWLHTITSQHIANLGDGESAESLDLDGNGRVLHHFVLTDLDEVAWLDTEPASGRPLLDYLRKMVFWAKAEPRDAHSELAVLSLLGPAVATVLPALGLAELPPLYRAAPVDRGGFLRRMPAFGPIDRFDLLVPRDELRERWDALAAAGATPAGSWSFEALRTAALVPRAGVDTDDRAIPHEVGWIGGVAEQGAVHLDKGCYRGQETVARVHNLGKPPRHLVLLHLDGSADGRPVTGDQVLATARAGDRAGTVGDQVLATARAGDRAGTVGDQVPAA